MRPPGTLLKRLRSIYINVYTQFKHVYRHPSVSKPRNKIKVGKKLLLKCGLTILIWWLVLAL